MKYFVPVPIPPPPLRETQLAPMVALSESALDRMEVAVARLTVRLLMMEEMSITDTRLDMVVFTSLKIPLMVSSWNGMVFLTALKHGLL